MTNIRKKYFLTILLLAGITISCRMNFGGPKPAEEIQVSPDAANNVVNTIQTVDEDLLTGASFTLTFSQDELTSYLVYRMDTSAYGISDPQVSLKDGLIVIYGQINQDFITANAQITLKPYVDSSGTPKMELVSIDLGPIPAPESLLSGLSSTIDQSLQDALINIPEGYQINSIEIAHGLMTITAQKI